LLLAFVVSAFAVPLPQITGRVMDNDGMTDAAAQAAQVARLANFETRSSDQIVVATLESLDGEAIESYANRPSVRGAWARPGRTTEILLLVARSDRKISAYGLRGTLTDLRSKLIIETTMLPRVSRGRLLGRQPSGR
jgi:uncharacterized protein